MVMDLKTNNPDLFRPGLLFELVRNSGAGGGSHLNFDTGTKGVQKFC